MSVSNKEDDVKHDVKLTYLLTYIGSFVTNKM